MKTWIKSSMLIFLLLSGLLVWGCSKYENFGNCVPSGDEVCDGVDNDCDGQTDETRYECADGSTVPWCGCDSDDNYECIDSPENQCRDTSCDDGSDDLCEMVPPDCEGFEILAIQNDCWVCVDPDTCEPVVACVQGEERLFECPGGEMVPWCDCLDGEWVCIRSPESQCRDASCDDGTEAFCDLIPPVCEDYEIFAYQNNCYLCVNPATCRPWGQPGCHRDLDCPPAEYCDDCASSSCPGCEDCVAGCLPHGCPTEPEPACFMERPDCGPGQVAVVEDLCWLCVDQGTCEASVCEPGSEVLFRCPDGEMVPWCFCDDEGGMNCMGSPEVQCRDSSCDDGSVPICEMVPPVCEDWEILAYQNQCYACVNPATCKPWGVPGCGADMQCDFDEYCDFCASSSCPGCDDCIAGCVEHACGGDDPMTLMCMMPRLSCNHGQTAIIRNGCWLCVGLHTCQPPDPCWGGEEILATCPDFLQVPWCTCTDAETWSCIDDPTSACHDSRCDDGTEPMCDMMPPICDPADILAYQEFCYLCVDPDTCRPRP
ncbi:MAG: hypothetical protein JRF33_14435 [Deltaproteobacteria bacterium]|nr:hypothetical protein [Deltaproteobacteria bacterium]